MYAPIFNGLGAADDFQKLRAGLIDFNTVEPAVANTFLANCWKYDKDSSPNDCRREIFSSETVRLIPMDKIKNPVPLAEVVKNLPAASEFVEIAGGSHIVIIEKPHYKKFRDTVLKFLGNP